MTAPQLVLAPSRAAPDRRASNRFPLREQIRYREITARSAGLQSHGSTIDISSGGVLFTTDSELPHGKLVEVAVNWPARLGGVCPLQLVAVGRVVRSSGLTAAVRIRKYQFKTRKAEADTPSDAAR